MDEILTVVHISMRPGERLVLKKLLANHPQIKLSAQLDSMEEALIFCPATLPSIIIISARLYDKKFLDSIESLVDRCPCSSFIATSDYKSEELLDAVRLAGIKHFIGSPFKQDLVYNLLFIAEEDKYQ